MCAESVAGGLDFESPSSQDSIKVGRRDSPCSRKSGSEAKLLFHFTHFLTLQRIEEKKTTYCRGGGVRGGTDNVCVRVEKKVLFWLPY